ncbi:hypothetical protein L1987_02952 [Smallanthus sonchifolius]|uniref:Uncharacterized protein n=1 Tax=Smallanthus sonchifolius TaxID=185202 RepID=A0ACB9K975_9ASTR|nr:hypothetical protein L1987_02952 [Smallanthus sonchifolius]
MFLLNVYKTLFQELCVFFYFLSSLCVVSTRFRISKVVVYGIRFWWVVVVYIKKVQARLSKNFKGWYTAVPSTAEINHQSPSPAPPTMQNSHQMPPMFWPHSGGIPPPYPRPPFVMGPESILYHNQRHSWAIGLCDCFSDLKISLLVLLCPCVAFGKIAEIINEGETRWERNKERYRQEMPTMYPQAPPKVQEMSR